jgi:hypothetical protein
MVGIGEQNLDAEFFKHILRDALDRSQCANRHEHRRLDLSVRSDELASAGGAAGGFNLQANRHRGILTEVMSWRSIRPGNVPTLAGETATFIGLPQRIGFRLASDSPPGRSVIYSRYLLEAAANET